jgi:cysteine desulfurase
VLQLPIYMDNHATTRIDPRVLEAMLPYFTETFGNSGSTTHSFGHAAKEAVDTARHEIAAAIGARPKEIIFTSGATESNNLAIKGVAERQSRRGKHIISVVTEHPAVLDPLKKLAQHGFEVTLLPVTQSPSERAGMICVEQVAEALREDTILVSVMLANNEIGAIQPVAEIGRLCHERGVLLHSDATQAVGKIPVDVEQLHVDLMSFTAHKIYGPKGIGALYVRSGGQARPEPILDGGGQERGLRSGTLNTPGIVGFCRALQLCLMDLPGEAARLRELRDGLYAGLTAAISGVALNGPALSPPELRLPGNLNVSFAYVDGEALLMNMREVALSSGSACTSATPEPSHVLRSLGPSDDVVRSSVRFGLGRFNTAEEVEFTVAKAAETIGSLRKMSSAAEERGGSVGS